MRNPSEQVIKGYWSEPPSRAGAVLYVAGSGRSGSTLLERVVDRVPRCFPVAEVVFLWQGGVRDNAPCGCGVPFRECPFWIRVGEEASGGWEGFDVDGLLALVRRRHGVAFSAFKKVRRPEAAGGQEYMASRSPTGTAVEWLVDNTVLDLLRIVGVSLLRLRSESLVGAPREHLAVVLGHAGRPVAEAALDSSDDSCIDLATDHTVSGSPLRFQRGRVVLLRYGYRRRVVPC